MSDKQDRIRKVVDGYKIARGIAKDNVGWNRANYGRYSKAAKSILECFNFDTEKAVFHVIRLTNEYLESNFTFTLETIQRHLWDQQATLTKEAYGRQPEQVATDNTMDGQGRLDGPTEERGLVSRVSTGSETPKIHNPGHGDMGGPWDD